MEAPQTQTKTQTDSTNISTYCHIEFNPRIVENGANFDKENEGKFFLPKLQKNILVSQRKALEHSIDDNNFIGAAAHGSGRVSSRQQGSRTVQAETPSEGEVAQVGHSSARKNRRLRELRKIRVRRMLQRDEGPSSEENERPDEEMRLKPKKGRAQVTPGFTRRGKRFSLADSSESDSFSDTGDTENQNTDYTSSGKNCVETSHDDRAHQKGGQGPDLCMKSNRDSVAGSRAIASVLATKAHRYRSFNMALEAGLKAKSSPENTTIGDPEPKMQAENPTTIHGVSDGDQKGRIKGGIGDIKNTLKHPTPSGPNDPKKYRNNCARQHKNDRGSGGS